jgi:hypothetical protein
MSKVSDRFALSILAFFLVYAICRLGFNALTLDTWMDEGKYLMKGYWYVTGKIPPYSEIDPTYYMPLVFYADGLVQWLFGIGYLPGRILMILFSVACLVLVYLVGENLGRSRLAGVGATALVVGHPVTMIYFATATPYAMVSCLSLLLIYVLLTMRSRRRAYAASGLILWTLVFTRPDMLPIAMIPTGWAFLIEPRRKLECLAIAFLTFIIASVVTLWIFGPGLLQVVLDVPGIAQIAKLLGVPAAPISTILPLTISPLEPVVHLRELPGYFYGYFLKPYSVVAGFSLAMIVLRIVRASREASERRVKPIDLILSYFWITAILHFLLSLSYCVDCIIPYTNYFLPVGALAAASLLREFFRHAKSPRLAFVALGCVLALAATTQLFPPFPTLFRPQGEYIRMVADELATQLRPNLPASKRVLVLSGDVAPSQAVWLAGGVVEPRSMYLPSTFREPKPELPKEERDKIDSLIWGIGFWSENSMREALATRYETLLIERRSTYADPIRLTVRDGIPFGDVAGKYFRLAATAKVNDRIFELYQRRE